MRFMHLLSLALLLVFMSCGGEVIDDSAFRVSLVTPGSVSDGGWNQAAYEGLTQIAAQLGATTSHVEIASPAAFEEVFRDFAHRGTDLVIGHGFEFQDAATTVAADFPETAFVVTSGLEIRENVAGLVFRLEEAAFLAGTLAAGLSNTGIAGMVGGMEIPPVRFIFDGFQKGFLHNNPGGEVKEVFLGNWDDIASARQATLGLLDQKADIIIHNADAAGLGVFQACRERSVLAIGSNSDQASLAPEIVIASAIIDIPSALVAVATDVQDGSFAGRIYTFNLESGIVDLRLNPDLTYRISEDLRSTIDDARSDILAGKVELEHFGS